MEEKTSSGLGIILIIVLIMLCGYFVWMYFTSMNEEKKESKISDGEALNLVEEKYIMAVKVYKLQNVFKLGTKININEQDYYEITDYDEIMGKLFTDNGIKEFENHHAGTIIKQADKIYIKAVSIDEEISYNDNYNQTTFTQEEIKKDKITYIAKAIYVEKEEEHDFILKKKNKEWLIDKFIFPYKK